MLSNFLVSHRKYKQLGNVYISIILPHDFYLLFSSYSSFVSIIESFILLTNNFLVNC